MVNKFLLGSLTLVSSLISNVNTSVVDPGYVNLGSSASDYNHVMLDFRSDTYNNSSSTTNMVLFSPFDNSIGGGLYDFNSHYITSDTLQVNDDIYIKQIFDYYSADMGQNGNMSLAFDTYFYYINTEIDDFDYDIDNIFLNFLWFDSDGYLTDYTYSWVFQHQNTNDYFYYDTDDYYTFEFSCSSEKFYYPNSFYSEMYYLGILPTFNYSFDDLSNLTDFNFYTKYNYYVRFQTLITVNETSISCHNVDTDESFYWIEENYFTYQDFLDLEEEANVLREEYEILKRKYDDLFIHARDIDALYNELLNDQPLNGIFNILTKAIKSVGAFLGIQIAPGLSLGIVITIPIVIAVVFFVLKSVIK